MQVKYSLGEICFISFIFDVFSVKRLDSYFQQDAGKRKNFLDLLRNDLYL